MASQPKSSPLQLPLQLELHLHASAPRPQDDQVTQSGYFIAVSRRAAPTKGKLHQSYPSCSYRNCLGKYITSNIWMETSSRDNIDLSSKEVFQIVHQVNMRKERRTLAKFHKDVYIAVRSLLFAGTRTKHPKPLGRVLLSESVYLITPRANLIQHAHSRIDYCTIKKTLVDSHLLYHIFCFAACWRASFSPSPIVKDRCAFQRETLQFYLDGLLSA